MPAIILLWNDLFHSYQKSRLKSTKIRFRPIVFFIAMYKESQSHGLDVFDLPIVTRNLSQQTVSRRISLTNFRIKGFMQVLFPTRCFCHQSTVTCVERCCADPPWLVFFFFIHEPRCDDIILSANSPSKENHFENFPYLFRRRDSYK